VRAGEPLVHREQGCIESSPQRRRALNPTQVLVLARGGFDLYWWHPPAYLAIDPVLRTTAPACRFSLGSLIWQLAAHQRIRTPNQAHVLNEVTELYLFDYAVGAEPSASF